MLVDNQPKTTADKQVVSDVFGNCQGYPHITKSTHTNSEVTQRIPDMESLPEMESLPIEQSKVKTILPRYRKNQSNVKSNSRNHRLRNQGRNQPLRKHGSGQNPQRNRLKQNQTLRRNHILPISRQNRKSISPGL